MKTISSEDLRVTLQRFWSHLTMIWSLDPKKEIMGFGHLPGVIKECSVAHIKQYGTIWDCDKYALALHAGVQRYQYDLFEQGKASETPWAFGECLGLKFKGWATDHAVNICLTDNGIYLIEPQTNEIWKADSKEDAPFFVKF